MAQPCGATVLVHGDVWPGNMAWTDDNRCTLIDWQTAGVGDPGVDIGELRKQIAVTYGFKAPASIVDGWEHTSGKPATNLACWDAVAALNTPTELGAVATTRRDDVLYNPLKTSDNAVQYDAVGQLGDSGCGDVTGPRQ